ncbi:hypothetical protein G1K52_11595 [Tenacibaculum finnmarkense]|uniref:hypothetical protein n=1 Tax=Tenacibaculum finnmarkense TaxID=2781243 RepID=UPI001EFAE0CA|nr:hypothetical protein [Tenacibaculum finnmarkense]MCG8786402.1 hypothetical protein [Tenacibaculum finnmarkense]
MKVEEINLEISKSKLNINLLLYRTVKDIIQSKISDKQIIILIEKIKILVNSNEDFYNKKNILFSTIDDLSKSIKVKSRISILIDNSINEEKHFRVFKLSLNLIRFKGYILEKSKLYKENFIASENIHIMDFEYDQKMLNLPYSMRVSGALLIKALFSEIEFNSNSFYEPIKSDIDKINEIDPEIILQIIFAESASQSIKSISGNSYEERFENVLKLNLINYTGQSFDSNIQAVEYDFKLSLENGKSIGISAKRTLRERYKQNHEDVKTLDVDAMILVTLGIDLNLAKVNNILEKEKHYIFIASDLYNNIDYFKNNNRVYPLNKLNNTLLKTLV